MYAPIQVSPKEVSMTETALVAPAALVAPVQAMLTKEDPALITPAPPPKKERDMLWDNSKLILTVLVTTGHIIMNFKIVPCEMGTLRAGSFRCENLDVAFAFYTWFHMFEMPGFIFISGYFSRSFVKVK
eukprot:5594380-Pyramimonas_sp.AAC.1